MLCCKPAKKKDNDDNDGDDDDESTDNSKGKERSKKTGKSDENGTGIGVGKSRGIRFPGAVIVGASKPIQINLNIPGLSYAGGEKEDPFRMLEDATPSNFYESSD
ncbi:unnamed protein product [Dibothriocephalus latus]|uniref:Uncharacterized protein n=1 Tax=Dibothriocephalus latus TaxID=60516 RepID=A0A3P6TQA3_DIBLA|nr:unnamed protein product [Dibothriocephalus latus]